MPLKYTNTNDNNVGAGEEADYGIRHRRELPGNYLYFQKYGNLPLCLENYALFLLPPIFTKTVYTYTLSNIIYLEEPSGNIISNHHGTFIHIFMHGYYPI